MKKIKLTEEQLSYILSELDVNAITKAAQEYGTNADRNEKKFKADLQNAISGNQGSSSSSIISQTGPVKESKSSIQEKNSKKNLEEDKNSSIFAERNFTKQQIYEAVSKFYVRTSS